MDTDRVVRITGSAGGIGTVLVERFLANGDTVVATDNRSDVLQSWRGRWPDEASSTRSQPASPRRGTAGASPPSHQEELGRVDVFINCAGYFPLVPFEEMSAQDWQHVIGITLTGTFLGTQAVLPLMKDRGWGRVVNFGSGFVFDGTPGHAHYVAAKAGVMGFSRSLAREVGGYGITMNAVTPA